MLRSYPVSHIQVKITELLTAAGYPLLSANAAVSQIIYAEQSGISSHGLVRVQWLLKQVDKFLSSSVKELLVTDTSMLFDAKGVLGYLALEQVIDRVLSSTSNSKVRFVGIRNTYPTGVLGYYAEEFARQGWIALMSSSSPSRVGMPGDERPTVGTSPFTLSVPSGDNTDRVLIIDTSLASLTHGRCLEAAAKGEDLPKNSVYSFSGESISSSKDLFSQYGAFNALIAPVGGEQAYKCYSILLGLQLLSRPLLNIGPDEDGTFFMLLHPSIWEPVCSREEIIKSMQIEIDRLEGLQVGRVPNKRRHTSRQENLETLSVSEEMQRVLNL